MDGVMRLSLKPILIIDQLTGREVKPLEEAALLMGCSISEVKPKIMRHGRILEMSVGAIET